MVENSEAHQTTRWFFDGNNPVGSMSKLSKPWALPIVGYTRAVHQGLSRSLMQRPEAQRCIHLYTLIISDSYAMSRKVFWSWLFTYVHLTRTVKPFTNKHWSKPPANMFLGSAQTPRVAECYPGTRASIVSAWIWTACLGLGRSCAMVSPRVWGDFVPSLSWEEYSMQSLVLVFVFLFGCNFRATTKGESLENMLVFSFYFLLVVFSSLLSLLVILSNIGFIFLVFFVAFCRLYTLHPHRKPVVRSCEDDIGFWGGQEFSAPARWVNPKLVCAHLCPKMIGFMEKSWSAINLKGVTNWKTHAYTQVYSRCMYHLVN